MYLVLGPNKASSGAHRDRDQRAVPDTLIRAAPEARLATALAASLLCLLDGSPAAEGQRCIGLD